MSCSASAARSLTILNSASGLPRARELRAILCTHQALQQSCGLRNGRSGDSEHGTGLSRAPCSARLAKHLESGKRFFILLLYMKNSNNACGLLRASEQRDELEHPVINQHTHQYAPNHTTDQPFCSSCFLVDSPTSQRMWSETTLPHRHRSHQYKGLWLRWKVCHTNEELPTEALSCCGTHLPAHQQPLAVLRSVSVRRLAAQCLRACGLLKPIITVADQRCRALGHQLTLIKFVADHC